MGSRAPIRSSEHQKCFDNPLGLELSGNIVLMCWEAAAHCRQNFLESTAFTFTIRFQKQHVLYRQSSIPSYPQTQRKYNSISALDTDHHNTNTETVITN